jgi:hypothetical protein
MTISQATEMARAVVADLFGADQPIRRLAAVTPLLSDELDWLSGVVDRLTRQVR